MVSLLVSLLGKLFGWLVDGARFLIPLILSVPGLMVIALGSIGVFVSTIFSRFTWLASATQYVQQATQIVQQFGNEEYGAIGQFLLGWFGFGNLAIAITSVITMTVGATIAVFVTLLIGIVAIVPLVYAVRAALRTINLAKTQLGK